MKTLFQNMPNRTQQLTAALAGGAVALSLAVGSSTAHATGFTLGDAGNYGVLFQGGGGNDLNVNNGPGIAGLAANGNVDFAGAVIDNGPYSGNIVVNGVISGGHANVQNDLNYLNSLSTTLGAEAGTVVTIGGNQTINISAGTPDALGNIVFTATTASFNNGQTLTINGDGIHNVVFNLSGAATFGGHIVLTGGLTSDQVLFNVHGGNDTTLSGGPTLSINNNGDTLTGTFLDPNGQVS